VKHAGPPPPGGPRSVLLPTLPPAPTPMSSIGGAASVSRPPTPTPTPLPDCGQTGLVEPGAATGYVNDPGGTQGQPHVDYGSGPLVTLAERDAFRASLPPGTNLGLVNDAIARGCSANWIRGHLDVL
jgi:hypothetical protein